MFVKGFVLILKNTCLKKIKPKKKKTYFWKLPDILIEDFLGPAITNVNALSREVLPTLKGDNHWLLSYH